MTKIKNMLKKGFTLTELAIVIAVIAILVAVLVPTFISLINKANESSDMQLVSNLNTSLSIAGTPDSVETDDGTIYNVTTAITSVRGDGYDVSKITPTADGGDIVYNATKNKFVYYAEDFTDLAYGEVDDDDVLVVVDANLSRVGIAEDVLDNTIQYCVYSESGVEISTNEAINIWVYTESGTSTIDATAATVYRYGTGEKDNAAVASESYHLYGKVKTINLEQGHLDIKNENGVTDVILSVTTGDNQPYVTGGNVEYLVIDTTAGIAYSTETENKNTVTATNKIPKGTQLKDVEGYGTETNPYVAENEDTLATIVKNSSTAVTVSVSSSDNSSVSTITVTNNDGSVTITGDTISADYYKEISSSSVTLYLDSNIDAYAFNEVTTITEVVIGDSVTSIGNYAFYGCTGLTSITIGSGVTSIGSYAFSGCTKLTKINYNAIKATNLNANNYTFYNVGSNGDGITVKIGAEVTQIPNRLFYPYTSNSTYAPKITNVEFEEGSACTSIGQYTFYNCTSLTSIEIPDGVTSISSSVFYGCTGLTNVTIPESVTSIGMYAFQNCTSLTSIVIPDKVTTINTSAFEGCSGLESITIGSGVTSISNNAFKNCTGVTEINYNATALTTQSISDTAFKTAGNSEKGITVNIGANVTVIGKNSFKENANVKEVNFAEGSVCTEIQSYAFYKCTSLTSIKIPDSVTTIGMNVFYGSGLENVIIGNGVTEINQNMFYGCTSLTSVTIGSNVTTIGSKAFQNCTALTSITIPSSVTTINGSAFNGCTSLSMVNSTTEGECIIPDTVTSIDSSVFTGCTSLKSATISKGLTTTGQYTFQNCTSLESVTIPDSVTIIRSCAFMNTALTSVTIPDSVTTIESSAFSGCKDLTSITIGNGVTSIGTNAFKDVTCYTTTNGLSYLGTYLLSADTSIASCIIDGSTTVIVGSAFKNCTLLTSITIPDSVVYIGLNAFEGCTGLESVTLGSGVTAISDSLFYGCTSLKSITIPSGVTSIGDMAFYGCTSLTSIFMPESITSIGSSVFYMCSALTSITLGNDGTANSAGYITINNTLYGLSHAAYSTDYYYELIIHANASGATSITIPEKIGNYDVKLIESYAFYGNTSLTSIDIPDNITYISDHAFEACTALESVNIGSSCYHIGQYAFYNCTALKTVVIEDGETELEISTYAFAVATTKTSVLESIVLPKRVTEIRYNAFECCKTVTVYYCGTAKDESAITSTDVSDDSSANGLSYYFKYEGNTICYYAESGSTTETGNYWYYDANGDITPWSISASE